MPDDPVALPLLIQNITTRFEIIDGDLRLSDADFLLSFDEMTRAPAGERDTLGQALLALAIKIQREGQGAGAPAIAQIYLLVGQLLSDFARAQALFEAGGVDLSKAAEWLGQQRSVAPVKKGNLMDGSSVFGLRLSTKNNK